MNRVQTKIVLEALENPSLLSDWEWDFVNDMANKPDDFTPSEKQNKIINRIGSRLAEE